MLAVRSLGTQTRNTGRWPTARWVPVAKVIIRLTETAGDGRELLLQLETRTISPTVYPAVIAVVVWGKINAMFGCGAAIREDVMMEPVLCIRSRQACVTTLKSRPPSLHEYSL